MKQENQASDSSLRKCIVNNQPFIKSDLIRFVISPNNEVFPDIYEKLDGRGVWVTATKSAVNQAIEKKLFAKAFKQKVTINPNLVINIETILKQKCLNLISLSKKANVLVSGFEKLKHALKKDEIYLLITASDGGKDSIKKMLSLTKKQIPIINQFNSEELGKTIGRENSVFMGIKNSDIMEKLLAEHLFFCKFTEKDVKAWKKLI